MSKLGPKKVVNDENIASTEKTYIREGVYKELGEFGKSLVDEALRHRNILIEDLEEAENDIDTALRLANRGLK